MESGVTLRKSMTLKCYEKYLVLIPRQKSRLVAGCNPTLCSHAYAHAAKDPPSRPHAYAHMQQTEKQAMKSNLYSTRVSPLHGASSGDVDSTSARPRMS